MSDDRRTEAGPPAQAGTMALSKDVIHETAGGVAEQHSQTPQTNKPTVDEG